MTEHYTDGRRWSYISNAWVLKDSWNDSEEIAMLRHRLSAPTPASEGDVEWVARAIFLAEHEDSDFSDCPESISEEKDIARVQAKAAIAAYNSKPDGEGKL